MKKFILAVTAAVMAAGVVVPAEAASINARQVNQRRLIDAGERSGKLTPREVSRLRAEQRSIELEKAKLKARGHYSARDKQIIHDRQAAAEMHIRNAKSNGRKAPSKRVLGAKVF